MEEEELDETQFLLLRLPNRHKAVHHVREHHSDQLVEPRFFFGLCPVSLSGDVEEDTAGAKLKACSGCLSVCYAGRQEQREHWKRHRAVLKKRGGGEHPLSGHPERRAEVQSALEERLRRPLSQFETDMLLFPRLCNVCFDGAEARLFNCPRCSSAAYCSPEHQEEDADHHALSCGHLDTARWQHAADAGAPGGKGLDALLVDFKFTFHPKLTPLPPDMDAFLREELPRSKALDASSPVFEAALRQLSLRLSGPLSALNGLLAAQTPLPESSALTVHVVGARAAEARDLHAWEVFPARLGDSVIKFAFVFIGPELSCPFPATDFEHESRELRRRRPGVTVRYVFLKQSYEEAFRGDRRLFPKPDLVVALNCGFIFYKSWDGSIPLLLSRHGVPLVFTEYYQEDCRLNLEKVRSLVASPLNVRLLPSANPFSSLLPARVPTASMPALRKVGRRAVLMSNDFICVVAKEKKK